MLTKEHKELIAELAKRTANDSLTWKKGDSRYSFSCILEGKNSFTIDKYYAVTNEKSETCLNLAIRDSVQKLILEIVLCKAINGQIDDYEILNKLYKDVTQKVTPGDTNTDISTVASITQSLQQL